MLLRHTLNVRHQSTMKRRILIAVIVLLNIALLFAAMLVEGKIEQIQRYMFEQPLGLIAFGSLGLFICLMLLLRLKIFRKTLWKVSLGLAVLLTQLVHYSILHLNQSMATKGEYVSGSVKDANWYQNGDYSRFTVTLSIIGLRQLTFVVDPEICVKVDSIQLRIDEGLFGLKVASNDLRLIEKDNCEMSLTFKNYPVDSANHLTYHLALGDKYMNRRCFDNAIREFSACIRHDTLESKYFNRRARVYLSKRQYKNALVDYYQAAKCEAYSIDSNFVNFVDTVNYADYVEEFISRTMEGDFKGISENMARINQVESLANYQYWMNYCYDKIK